MSQPGGVLSRHYVDVVGRHLSRFMHLETSAGLILIAAMVAAMVVKNSPIADFYAAFLRIEGEIRLGTLSVEKPLFLWVNDFQMAIFFFLVGLELKREVLMGHLRDKRQIVLPAAGAIGGVLVPALIYLSLNYSNPDAIAGWAVPTATDIAFALAILALVGSRLPAGLKVFLMTLAILDDLIAIVVIALFYTEGLSPTSLMVAAFFVIGLIVANRLRIRGVAPYLLLGIGLWVCVLKSGVHATLAGVITAFFIPAGISESGQRSTLEELIDKLHPWVAFGILPLFAFVNAGISLEGLNPARLLEPIPLGISLGLFLGKPLGVFCLSGLVILFGLAKLPTGVNWVQLLGVAIVCGVGFTMSLFIGGLAFAEGGPGYARIDRLGILTGSMLSAVVGYVVLKLTVLSADDAAVAQREKGND